MATIEFVRQIIRSCQKTRYIGFFYDLYPMDLQWVLDKEGFHLCIVPTQHHKNIIRQEYEIDEHIEIMSPHNAFSAILLNTIKRPITSISFTFCHLLTKEYHLLLRFCSYLFKKKSIPFYFFSSNLPRKTLSSIFPLMNYYENESMNDIYLSSNIHHVGEIDIMISTEFHISECKRFVHDYYKAHLINESMIWKRIVIYIPCKRYFDKIVESLDMIENTHVYLLNRKSSLSMIHTVIKEMKCPRQHILCFVSPFFEGMPLFEKIDVIIDTGISLYHHNDHIRVSTLISKKENILQKLKIQSNCESLQSYFLLFPESTYLKTDTLLSHVETSVDIMYIYLQSRYHHIPISSLLSVEEIKQCRNKFLELNIRPETLYLVDISHFIYNIEGMPIHILSMIRFLHRNSHLYHDHVFLLFVCIMTIFFFQKYDGAPFDTSSSHNPYLFSGFSIRTEFSFELEELFIWVTLFINYFISPDQTEYCRVYCLDVSKMNQIQKIIFKTFNVWIYRITSISISDMSFLIPSGRIDSKITYLIHPDYREQVRLFFYRQCQFELIPLHNMIMDNCLYSIHFRNITNPHMTKTFLQKDYVPRFIINLSSKKDVCEWRNYDKSVISLFIFTPLYHLKLFQNLKDHINSFLERRDKQIKARREYHRLVIRYIQDVVSKGPYMVNDAILNPSLDYRFF